MLFTTALLGFTTCWCYLPLLFWGLLPAVVIYHRSFWVYYLLMLFTTVLLGLTTCWCYLPRHFFSLLPVDVIYHCSFGVYYLLMLFTTTVFLVYYLHADVIYHDTFLVYYLHADVIYHYSFSSYHLLFLSTTIQTYAHLHTHVRDYFTITQLNAFWPKHTTFELYYNYALSQVLAHRYALTDTWSQISDHGHAITGMQPRVGDYLYAITGTRLQIWDHGHEITDTRSQDVITSSWPKVRVDKYEILSTRSQVRGCCKGHIRPEHQRSNNCG